MITEDWTQEEIEMYELGRDLLPFFQAALAVGLTAVGSKILTDVVNIFTGY